MNEPITAWDYIRAFLELREQTRISTNVLALYVYLLQASERINDGIIDGSEFSLRNDALISLSDIEERAFIASRNKLHQLGVICYTTGNRNVNSPKYKITHPNSYCKNAVRSGGNMGGNKCNSIHTIDTIDTIDSNYSNNNTIDCKNAVRNGGNIGGNGVEMPNTRTITEVLVASKKNHIQPTETALFQALSNEAFIIKYAKELYYEMVSSTGVQELKAIIEQYCRWYCANYNTGMANNNIAAYKAFESLKTWIVGNKDQALHSGFRSYLKEKHKGKDIDAAIECATLDAEAKGTKIANWQSWVEIFVTRQWERKNTAHKTEVPQGRAMQTVTFD